MSLVRRGLVSNLSSKAGLSLLVLAAGCVPSRPASPVDSATLSSDELARAPESGPHAPQPAVGFSKPGTAPPSDASAPAGAAAAHVEGGPELSRSALIRAVLARNPSVEARRQAVRAARAERPQVDAWDDPMVAYSFAPMSIGSGATFGQTIQVSQRFPWPGKLSSRGDSADFEANAAKEEVRVTELDLALEASMLFDDYYLVDRAIEVNAHHKHLLDELKQAAETQYSVGHASLRDPLQAEVELSRLAEQEVMLRSKRAILVASINALLHRAPAEPLPPPPKVLDVTLTPPASEADLTRIALEASPELRGLRAKERAAEARARYAKRAYYPDLTLMASYSTMFMPDHRLMVGVEAPIPLQRGSRGGALDQADANIAEARSESARVSDRIRADVSVARQAVLETIAVVKIYDGRLVPAARDEVSAARSDFTVGSSSFYVVVDGEKSLREVELMQLQAVAELSKRRAKLDRTLGRVPFGDGKAGRR